MDLLEIRKEIDDIDEKLIPLLLDRMECSKKVAEYKVARGIPVLNEEREQQILNDVGAKCGDKGETIKTVFSAIMDASRALQHKNLRMFLKLLIKTRQNSALFPLKIQRQARCTNHMTL